jgi:hypothetical protein
MNMNINGTEMVYTGDISGISSGKQYNINVNGKVADMDITSSMIMDLYSGNYAYSTMTPDGNTVWYKININEIMSMIGIDMDSLLNLSTVSKDLSYPDSFALALKTMSNSFTVATYDALCMSSDIVNKLMSNDAFTARTTESDGSILFTSTITDISSLVSDNALSDMIKQITDKFDLSITIGVLQNPDGTAKSSSFDLRVAAKDSSIPFGGISLSCNVTKDSFDMDFDMSADSFKTDGDMQFTIAETSKTVDTSLPEGVNPVDITEMVKMIFEAAKNPEALSAMFPA